jgi:hypothetical protein
VVRYSSVAARQIEEIVAHGFVVESGATTHNLHTSHCNSPPRAKFLDQVHLPARQRMLSSPSSFVMLITYCHGDTLLVQADYTFQRCLPDARNTDMYKCGSSCTVSPCITGLQEWPQANKAAYINRGCAPDPVPARVSKSTAIFLEQVEYAMLVAHKSHGPNCIAHLQIIACADLFVSAVCGMSK